MKTCSKCKIDQPISNFTRDKSRADGLFPQCKVCRKADKHQYYLDHKEEIFHKSKEWHRSNPESSRAIKKRYRDTHKDEIAERMSEAKRANPERFSNNQKRSYRKNRDRILARNRTYYEQYPERQKLRYRKHRDKHRDVMNERSRRWYAEHKEIHNERVRRWDLRNPHKRLTYVHARRARRLENGGRYTLAEWEALKDQYNHTCLCCYKIEPTIRLTPDHVIPIARGGSNNIDNIQPLCLQCNKSKAVKSTDYRKEYTHA